MDAGRLGTTAGILTGLAITAVGLAGAMLPGVPGVLVAAVGIGVGTGIVTPVAFAALAAGTPANSLGQTMGVAEVGRELGDAGGPLLVGGIATAVSLTAGFGMMAAILGAAALMLRRSRGDVNYDRA